LQSGPWFLASRSFIGKAKQSKGGGRILAGMVADGEGPVGENKEGLVRTC
jgi:hypothetical protein